MINSSNFKKKKKEKVVNFYQNKKKREKKTSLFLLPNLCEFIFSVGLSGLVGCITKGAGTRGGGLTGRVIGTGGGTGMGPLGGIGDDLVELL